MKQLNSKLELCTITPVLFGQACLFNMSIYFAAFFSDEIDKIEPYLTKAALKTLDDSMDYISSIEVDQESWEQFMQYKQYFYQQTFVKNHIYELSKPDFRFQKIYDLYKEYGELSEWYKQPYTNRQQSLQSLRQQMQDLKNRQTEFKEQYLLNQKQLFQPIYEEIKSACTNHDYS